MEMGMTFLIGLIAGVLLGKIAAERKTEEAVNIAIVHERRFQRELAGGGYRPKERGIVQLHRPDPPAGGSGMIKPNKMTDADRAACYIKMAALADNAPARDRISSRQRLLNKAEAIMDAAGGSYQPTDTK